MHPEDDEPSGQERLEAEALARALDRGTAREPVPDDALGTAALLRFAHGAAELDPERSRAILEEALATRRKPPVFRRIGIWASLGLATAAVGTFLLARTSEPSLLPPPPPELLSAQLSAAHPGSRESLAALEAEMRPYRGRVYAALGERARP